MAEVTVSHRYDATPEQVFDAWLDPARARRFLFATPDGEMVRCEIDPRVGGAFTIVERRPEAGEVEHVGEYRVIDRPRRLVFTFAVPQYSAERTVVSIDIEPEGLGCRLMLTHTGVLEAWAQQTEAGWGKILAALPLEA